MSFESQLVEELNANKEKFPLVDSIDTGQAQESGENLYIRVNCADAEMIEAGAAVYQPVKQTAVITLVAKLQKTDNEKDIRTQLETVSRSVMYVLFGNPLGSLLCSARVVSFTAPAKNVHGKYEVLFIDINFEGEYFL